MDCVCNWLKLDQLTLNVKKSKFILNSSTKRLNKIVEATADSKALDQLQSLCYLVIVVNSYITIIFYSPPYYDTVLIYRNLLKFGRKNQRNHEAYTTWAFHAKLLKINFINLTERQRRSNNNTKE